MGKEQDLLEAARTGNISVIEKILTQRAKLKGPLGPLASLRRTANPSCQDSNGDTPLHHAALNGHREVVQVLLRFEASANLMDNKGCYPLHMAAWNGHTDICRTLLTHGPSIAKVNQQNNDGETALHCAAQYGHTEAVGVLLEYHADPTLRNVKEESPLDLACQYGRLDTVQLLLKTHPNLLIGNTKDHNPLQLASRNGHKAVVQILLEAGCDIDRVTDTGSALHEAALFGRTEVVRLLLDSGIDAGLTDINHRTALDVIRDHKSQISIDISRAISEHISEKEHLARRASAFTHNTSEHSSPSRSSQYDAVYDDVPSPRPLISPRPSTSSSLSSDISALYAKPIDRRDRLLDSHDRDLDVDDGACDDDDEDNESLFPIDLEGIQSWNCLHQSITSETSSVYDSPGWARPVDGDTEHIYETPAPPVPVPRIQVHKTAGSAQSTPSPVCAMNRPSPKSSPRTHSPISPDTPKKPPRRKNMAKSLRQEEEVNKRRDVDKNANAAEMTTTTTTMTKEHTLLLRGTLHNVCDNNNEPKVDNRIAEERKEINARQEKRESLLVGREKRERQESVSEEKKDSEKADFEKEPKEKEVTENKLATTEFLSQQATSSELKVEKNKQEDEVSLRSDRSSTASSRPPSLEFGSKRSSREMIPLSPTGYEQPPTPDHPPPSPSTAILGIQEKINPKVKSLGLWGEKRRSRDMETITELEFLSPEDQTRSCCPRGPWPTTDEQTETDSLDGATEGGCLPCQQTEGSTGGCGLAEAGAAAVEVVTNGNDPFLDECHQCLTKGSLPVGQRRVKSQVYDNLLIGGAGRKQKRISAPGLFVNFDPVDEWDEREECENGNGTETGSKSKNGRVTSRVRVLTARKKMEAPKAPHRTRGDGSKGRQSSRDDSSPLDENEEWAKIEAILSSCGGRMSASEYSDYGYFEKRLQQIFNAEKDARDGEVPPHAPGASCIGRTLQSVGDWLESLGLAQYENTLIANGFDDMEFMGPNVLEDQDLTELGILVDEDRRKILDACATLPPLRSISEEETPESVEAWLASLLLSSYLDVFTNNNFTSMDRVRHIWELELNTVLDITTLGHRKRILASLRAPPEDDKWSQGDDIVDIVGAVDWTLSPFPEENASSSSSPAADINLFRDYTTVRSNYKDTANSTEGQGQLASNGQHDLTSPGNTEGDLPIRPPHLAHQESPIKQWRHRPDVLIRGCCNYSAQYLGSTLVRQLQGTESTKESINKLKKSADSIAKVPIIILSISYKGVKFIDGGSKKVVCEHEIGNIFCACQDGDNLNYFAYITKDLESAKHYCHVFCVKSTEQATEIILTLGEAFEIAYQMALKEKGEDGVLENTLSQTDLPQSPLLSPDGIDCGT